MRLLSFIFIQYLFVQYTYAATIVACVDCYGSASYFPIVAKEMANQSDDLQLIHIQTAAIDPVYQPSWNRTKHLYSKAFDVDVENTSELAKLASELKSLGVIYAWSGMEQGAFASGLINRSLNTSIGYDKPESRNVRRHKFAMQQALTEHGIPTLLTNNIDELMSFVQNFDSKQVVLKLPQSSAGESMVFLDASDHALIQAKFNDMLLKGKDFYGHQITHIIAQPRLVGREIAVNTINNKIVAAWEYHRIQHGPLNLYFIDRALRLSSPEVEKIRSVLPQAAADLEHQYGPAHWEWMLTDTGVRLIEMGARVGGAMFPMIDAQVYGTSQLHMEVQRILQPEQFKENFLKKVTIQQTGAIATLVAQRDGVIARNAKNLLKNLETLLQLPGLDFEPLAAFSQTVDLDSAPATLAFVGDFQQVKENVHELLRLQLSELLYDYNNNCQAVFTSSQLTELMSVGFLNAFKERESL